MNAEIGPGQGYEPGVGALLRASRLRRGEDLRDVAALLRIRYPFLEAIEAGRYQDLPGSAYAIGFVRTYAEHLGLDSVEVVRRFKAEAENLERRSDLVFPSPVAERSTPGGAIVFVGILMAAVAYGAWYMGTAKQSFLDDLVSPLPDRLTALLRGNGEEPALPPVAMPTEAPTAVPEEPVPAAPAPEAAAPDGQAVETAVPPPPGARGEPPVAPTPPAQTELAGRPQTPPPATVAPPPPAVAPQAPAAPTEPPTEASPPSTPPVARVEPPAAPAPAPLEAPTPPPAAAIVQPEPAPLPPPAILPQPAPDAPAATPAQPPALPEVATEAPATEQPAGQAETPSEGVSRILVRAKLDSWIQVRDGVARRLLVTRLLRAGETYEVPNLPSLSLLTGNAGGLEILVDGEPVPAIGGVGAVRRDVALEADRLKAGTAVVD